MSRDERSSDFRFYFNSKTVALKTLSKPGEESVVRLLDDLQSKRALLSNFAFADLGALVMFLAKLVSLAG